MKKIDLPLWTDTLFYFAATAAFAFCVLRFYIPSAWGAAAAAAAIAGCVAFLLFRLLRARRKRRREKEESAGQAAALAFHLAMRPPEEDALLIARCLDAMAEKESKGDREPSAKATERAQNDPLDAGAEPAEKGPPAASSPRKERAVAAGSEVQAGDARYFLLFRLEKVTADELRPAVRAEGTDKTALGGAFTPEAEKLASAFGIQLWGAEQVYELVKGAKELPSPLIVPPAAKKSKLSFRLRREAWRGYAFSGGFLLLFSLWAIFPIYYLVSGGLLLLAAVLVRLFGKRE